MDTRRLARQVTLRLFLQTPKAWEVTSHSKGRVPPKSHVNQNARDRNAIFEAISEDMFARVCIKANVFYIWDELEKIQVGSKKLIKFSRKKLSEFKMLPNE